MLLPLYLVLELICSALGVVFVMFTMLHQLLGLQFFMFIIESSDSDSFAAIPPMLVASRGMDY